MTKEEVTKMTQTYDEAIRKLELLGAEKQRIIKEYIAELEAQKVAALREALGLTDNS